MTKRRSLLDELHVPYEAVHESADDRGDAESFEAMDARMRTAFRGLEQAITYLNALKPPIEHKFDLGYGYVFDTPAVRPRLRRTARAPHRRFPVLEQIDVYYEISASKPLTIDVVPGWVSFAAKTLDAFGLQYTCRRVRILTELCASASFRCLLSSRHGSCFVSIITKSS
jgi:hypothetical protein